MPSRRLVLAAFASALAFPIASIAPKAVDARKSRKKRKKKRRLCTGNSKRCRCRREGQTCKEDANCCPSQRNLSCQSGTCRPCEVCQSGCDFDSIQAAIDVAAGGATIHVCPGVYRENLSIDDDVSLIGVGSGPDGTVLDGERNGPVVNIVAAGSKPIVVLQRLRITRGDAEHGGGIFNVGGIVTLTDCRIADNLALERGAGLFNEAGVMTLQRCTIENNATKEGGANGDGGGILNWEGGVLTIFDSTIRNNEAHQRGGGISNVIGSQATLIRSTVTGNRADAPGGGIFNFSLGSFVTLIDSTVINNAPTNCGGIFFPGCDF